jgi:hypothetical protein
MHFFVWCKGKMDRHRAAGELAGWKKGKHGIVLLFLQSFCDISPFLFIYLPFGGA